MKTGINRLNHLPAGAEFRQWKEHLGHKCGFARFALRAKATSPVQLMVQGSQNWSYPIQKPQMILIPFPECKGACIA